MTLGPGRTIVGRESGDILLHDVETSALHAEIEFTGGRVIVRDLGSRNGTWREGKRLPQFALYRGQTFRCGATDITLVEILGAEAPMPGGTASGSDDASSSSTRPSGAVLEASPAETISRGIVPPPSSSRTASVPSSPTLVGHAPVSTGAGAPAPIPEPPSASAPDEAPPDMGAPPPGVPAPVPTAASVPIAAPVANAVIKVGDARRRAPEARSPADRAARRRTIKRVLLGVGVAGLLGAMIFGIYSLIAARNQAFLRELAAEMPQDTVGVFALSSPRAALELFGDEVPSSVREEIDDNLGLDPFDPELFASWGLDIDEPMGLSLLDGDGMVAISIGVKDNDTMREALSKKVAEVIEADEDLRWIERSFAEMPGLWLDEPIAVAALLPRDRVIFVLGGPTEEVARHAKRIAETKKGESLADRPGFGEIQREKGKLLLAMYIDGGSGRAALPGDDSSTMATRMALADIEGFAFLLADDGPRLHLSTQTIMREGIDSLTLFEDVKRTTTILDRIPAPVLIEIDGVFSTEKLKSSLGSLGLLGLMAGSFEDEFREETSLDLRTDLLGNLDGQYGFVLQRLPGEDKKEEPAGMLMWAGLTDEANAKKTAERFFAKAGNDFDIELEQIEGTTVYTIDDRPRFSYFIHEGVLWATVGEVDIAQLMKGGFDSFRKSPRIAALKKATNKGGAVAGFFDIRELIAGARKSMDEDELEDLERWSPVVSPLEAITFRAELEGRTFVTRTTLHTSSEHALAGLLQGLMGVVGEEMAEKLAKKRRRERCDELIDHILDLMRAELASSGLEDDMLEHRYELMEECRGEQTTDDEIACMLEAKNLEALTHCEEGTNAEGGDGAEGDGDGGGAIPVKLLEQPEPVPVPYIEDIWPNTIPSGTATGRPDPTVSYAVPLGQDPAMRGPKDGLVTVVMFGDFQCPYCKRVLPTLDQLLAAQSEVRLVFRHNPLPMHAQAQLAAQAAIAAGEQGKFWPMHDKLFENQHALTEDNLRTLASDLGLDMVRFDRDLRDSAIKARVEADIADAHEFGATGTPGFFINGRYLGGAQPLAALETLVAEELDRAKRFEERRGNTRKRFYSDMIGHFAPQVVTPAIEVATPTTETRHTIATSGLPRRGTAGYVRVEIVECGDFDCPFCQRAETTLDQVLADYEGKVALFWLHNPLSFHAGAEPAARAAVAAHNQGKFWEMHDKLFEDRDKRSESDFISYASEIGIDTKQFELDLSDTSVHTTVTDQQKLCTDNEARGTPTFFINGRLLSGAQSYDKFKEVIDQELSGGI